MHPDQGWVTSPGRLLGEGKMKTHQRKRVQEKNAELELCFHDKPVVSFEADILAVQDFDRIHRSRPLSPERELMVAVLEEALMDYQRCASARDEKGMKRFAEAEAWILETDSEWIFSFINCCEVLGIDPVYLRRGLLRWKQGKHARLWSARNQKQQAKRLRQAA
jgi:hypothetical protein